MSSLMIIIIREDEWMNEQLEKRDEKGKDEIILTSFMLLRRKLKENIYAPLTRKKSVHSSHHLLVHSFSLFFSKEKVVSMKHTFEKEANPISFFSFSWFLVMHVCCLYLSFPFDAAFLVRFPCHAVFRWIEFLLPQSSDPCLSDETQRRVSSFSSSSLHVFFTLFCDPWIREPFPLFKSSYKRHSSSKKKLFHSRVDLLFKRMKKEKTLRVKNRHLLILSSSLKSLERNTRRSLVVNC